MATYISGPMTGHPLGNARAFREAAADLRARGEIVISPVELDTERGIDPEAAGDLPRDERRKALADDIARVAHPGVTTLTMLPGWEDSEGAVIEARVAVALDKPVRLYPLLGRIDVEQELVRKDRCAGTGDGGGHVRTFGTGATRDTDEGKPDYEGYLSPVVMQAFGRYLLRHSVQSDGARRASDNWQKGIPRDAYMKSAWRHFMDWWSLHRGVEAETAGDVEEAVCALLFNAQGYLHEILSERPA